MRSLAILTLLLLFVLIVYGGIVRVTASGGACLEWPTCLGSWKIPGSSEQASARLDYAHRALTVLTAISLFGGGVVAWRKFRSVRWVTWPFTGAIGLILTQVAIGAGLSSRMNLPGMDSILSAVHLTLALSALAILSIPCVYLLRQNKYPEVTGRFKLETVYSKISLSSLVLFILPKIIGWMNKSPSK